MKRILLLALAMVVAAASAASAQGYIGLFSDDFYTDCNLVDAGVGLCPVYLVQHYQTGISSSMRVVDNSGLTLTSVTVHTMLWIGDVFTGIYFSYGACMGPTVLLATLNYFCQGVTPRCSVLCVGPHPDTGLITLVDCQPKALTPGAVVLTVNGDASCPCISPNAAGAPSFVCEAPNPVEKTTWGQIKALYGGD